MVDVSGTPKKLILNGITFDFAADTNITEIGSTHENEVVPTSGRNFLKQTKRAENREGVTVIANGAEREILKELAESQAAFSMSYETAAGDVFRTVGWIEFESRETEENRATIQLLPRDPWNSFLAS